MDTEGPWNSIFKTLGKNLVHTKKAVVNLTLVCFGGDWRVRKMHYQGYQRHSLMGWWHTVQQVCKYFGLQELSLRTIKLDQRIKETEKKHSSCRSHVSEETSTRISDAKRIRQMTEAAGIWNIIDMSPVTPPTAKTPFSAEETQPAGVPRIHWMTL